MQHHTNALGLSSLYDALRQNAVELEVGTGLEHFAVPRPMVQHM